MRELKDAIAKIEGMPDVVAVVITGRGRSFSAGGDLRAISGSIAGRMSFPPFLDDFFQMLNAIEASSKITSRPSMACVSRAA